MKRYFTIILLLATIHILAAQDIIYPKEVTNLTIRDGLPHNAISTTLLDSKGYLWIGTFDGVAIYNSQKVSTIDFNKNLESLLGRRIRSFAEDSNGDIWIGSDIGIAKFDRDHYNLTELPLPLSGKTAILNTL